MSLAAEDDEQSRRFRARDPAIAMQFTSNRHRQPRSRLGASFFQPYSSRSDPMASTAHSLMGVGTPFDQEIFAALMADFGRAGNAGSTASGSGQQDMSYEALTNLEDVKLTAPPELLATMPLDMCLKGGQWDDKVPVFTHCLPKQCITHESSYHRCTRIDRMCVIQMLCACFQYWR